MIIMIGIHSFTNQQAAFLVFALHHVHHLLPALIQLLVRLPCVPYVFLAHLAQVFVLKVKPVHLFLENLYLFFVVAVHFHSKIARSVYRVCALLHKDYFLLQFLHFPLILFQLLDCGLIAALRVASLLTVCAGQRRRLLWSWRMRRLAMLEHQLLYSQCLALQLSRLVFALLP